MTVIQKTIGRLPVNLGDYNSTRAYGKKNRVLLYGCEWESKVNNNTYAPAALNTTTGVITPDTTHWKLISGSYNTWLIDNGYRKESAANVKDSTLNDTQDHINATVIGEIGSDSTPNTIKGRIKTLETNVGSGGSVDSRISSAVATETTRAQAAESNLDSGKADKATTLAGYGITDAYTKSETYSKTEINEHITTPNHGYVTAIANSNTTTLNLKSLIDTAAGSDKQKAEFIYRVGCWDGSQYNDTMYSEYAWIDTDYVFLSKKSQIDEVFDISAYHANTPYADLTAALGTNGQNIPQSLRKGGMSVKFIQGSVGSSDNKYVQFHYIGTDVTGSPNPFLNIANWEKITSKGIVNLVMIAPADSLYNPNWKVGDVWYNIGTKKLRECVSTNNGNNTGNANFVHEHNALYSCYDMLWKWNGTDLVPFEKLIRLYSITNMTGLSLGQMFYNVATNDIRIVSNIDTTYPVSVSQGQLYLYNGDIYQFDSDNKFVILEPNAKKEIYETIDEMSYPHTNLLNPFTRVDGKIINDSGNVVVDAGNSYFDTYIPVGDNTSVYVSYTGEGAGGRRIYAFDSSKNLISRDGIQGNNTWNNFPSNTAYISYQSKIGDTDIMLTFEDNVTSYVPYYTPNDRIARIEIDKVNTKVVKLEDAGRILNNAVYWENKSLTTLAGVSFASTTRILSTGFYQNLASATCENGYKIKVFGYNADKEYIGQWDGTDFSTSQDILFSYINLEALYSSAVYLRIIIAKTNSADILPTDCDKCIIVAKNRSRMVLAMLQNNFGTIYPDKLKIAALGGTIVGNDAVFVKEIGEKLYVRGSYQFPKDVHSINQEVDLFSIGNDRNSIKVSLVKATTGNLNTYPYDAVPKYNAGIRVYYNGTENVTFTPDGWRKDFLLGMDAMTIRYTGDCSIEANQDIRIKIDTTNIDIYHSQTNTIIHRFVKANFSTMRDLYSAIYAETQTGGDLTDFEVEWLNLNYKTPNDIIECDVNLVAEYYVDTNEETTRWDAFPFYFTLKQEGKTYDIEVLLDKSAPNYKTQILLNGCKISAIPKVFETLDQLFGGGDTITIHNVFSQDIVCNEFEISQEIKPKYANIRPIFIEACEESIEASSDYPTSLNQVAWFASLMRKYERQYIQLESIEQTLDSGIKTNTDFLWQLQVDDGGISVATNKTIREELLNNNIRPSVAIMMNEVISSADLQLLKATERAGFEYHIHATKTDAMLPMEYYSYSQMVANVDEAIEEFIEVFDELPIVWSMHQGNLWYRISKFLRSRGFRMIFGGVDLDASLNEITRYACKRAPLRDTGGESAYLLFKKSY